MKESHWKSPQCSLCLLVGSFASYLNCRMGIRKKTKEREKCQHGHGQIFGAFRVSSQLDFGFVTRHLFVHYVFRGTPRCNANNPSISRRNSRRSFCLFSNFWPHSVSRFRMLFAPTSRRGASHSLLLSKNVCLYSPSTTLRGKQTKRRCLSSSIIIHLVWALSPQFCALQKKKRLTYSNREYSKAHVRAQYLFTESAITTQF